MSDGEHNFLWAYHTDLTVHEMHKRGASLEDIIVRLVEEKNAFREDLVAKAYGPMPPLLVYTPDSRPDSRLKDFLDGLTAEMLRPYQGSLKSLADSIVAEAVNETEVGMTSTDVCQVCGKPVTQGLCRHLSGEPYGIPPTEREYQAMVNIRAAAEDYHVNTEAYDRLLNPNGRIHSDGSVIISERNLPDCVRFSNEEHARLVVQLRTKGIDIARLPLQSLDLGEWLGSKDFQQRVATRLEEYRQQWPHNIQKE